MGLSGFQIAMVAAILLVGGALALEIRGWLKGSRMVTRRQKALRIASAALMLSVLAMLLIGDRAVRAYHPLAAVAYWTVCFGFAVSLIVLALLDLKEVGLRYGEQMKRMLDNLAGRGRDETDAE